MKSIKSYVISLFFGLGKVFDKINTKYLSMERKGIIGEYFENGFPVIMKFINELPNKEVMNRFHYLVIVSWKYNGKENNGMPENEINKRMILLEDTIGKSMKTSKIFLHAYSRTGNNLKELVYYCTNQTDFMALLNKTLQHHEDYPIEIDFYEDKDWREFKQVLDDFKGK